MIRNTRRRRAKKQPDPHRNHHVIGLTLGVVVLSGAALVAQDGSSEWRVPSSKARKANPIPATEDSIEKGKKVYVAECLACHGSSGKGDGPAAKDLRRSAGDLSNAAVMGTQNDGALFWKTRIGKTPMPGYRKTLTDEEMWHVVNYIRTLAPAESAASPKFSVPEPHRQALSNVLAVYLKIHRALTKEDVARVRKEMGALEKAVAALEMPEAKTVSETIQSSWDRSRKSIREAATILKDSKAIASQRAAFLTLSEALASSLEDFGHADQKPPRLFNGFGVAKDAKACWIQKRRAPENPYGGTEGTPAGKIQKVFAPTRAPR